MIIVEEELHWVDVANSKVSFSAIYVKNWEFMKFYNIQPQERLEQISSVFPTAGHVVLGVNLE